MIKTGLPRTEQPTGGTERRLYQSFAVARVAAILAGRVVLAVAEVVVHLALLRRLHRNLG